MTSDDLPQPTPPATQQPQQQQPPQQYPPFQTYTHAGYTPPPTNGMGIAGFVVSLSGLILTAGFICPIGLVLSLIGLGKEPRGFAIAAFFVLALAGFFGNAFTVANMFGMHFITQQNMDSASWDIDFHFDNNNDTLPDKPTGDNLINGYYDEWGTQLDYRPIPSSTQDYEIVSAGPDTSFGTADDIVQQYTANTFGSGISMAEDFAEEAGPGPDQIDYAFNQAAERINGSLPPGSPLPDANAGTKLITTTTDAWGRTMQYAPTTNPPFYHLKSAGPDGQWQTEDDITRSFYFEPTGNP